MSAFLRNQWYTAATAEELGTRPLGRRICNEPIAFFRRSDGSGGCGHCGGHRHHGRTGRTHDADAALALGPLDLGEIVLGQQRGERADELAVDFIGHRSPLFLLRSAAGRGAPCAGSRGLLLQIGRAHV